MTKAKDKQSKRQADKATHKTKQETDSADERSDRIGEELEAPPIPKKQSRAIGVISSSLKNSSRQ